MRMDELIKNDEIRTVGLENAPNQNVDVGPELIAALTIQQYKDPLFATLRELITNGVESMVKAGRETQRIKLTLEFGDEDVDLDDGTGARGRSATFCVRDFGLGMTPEFVLDGYYVTGRSTKRDDSTVGGAFGLGAKAVFGIATAVRLTSFVNGVRYEFLAGMQEGFIRVIEIAREVTDEPDGVLISFTTVIRDAALFKRIYRSSAWDCLYSDDDINSFKSVVIHAGHRSQGGDEKQKEAAKILEGFKIAEPVSAFISTAITGTPSAILKATMPVGHPGSTYKAIPEIWINGLPLLLKDWDREADYGVKFRHELRRQSADYHCFILHVKVSGERYLAQERTLTLYDSRTGELDRMAYLPAIFGDKRSQFIFWHNAYYAYDGFKSESYDTKEARIKKRRRLLDPPVLRTRLHRDDKVEGTECFFIPANMVIPITPERTALRNTDTSWKLINQYDAEVREQLAVSLANVWLTEFESAKETLLAEVKSNERDSFRSFEDWHRRVRQPLITMLNTLSDAAMTPALDRISELTNGLVTSDTDRTLWRLITAGLVFNKDRVYQLDSTQLTAAMAVTSINARRQGSRLSILPVADNGTIRPPRIDASAGIWARWIVADDYEKAKQWQKDKSLNQAVYFLSQDRPIVDQLVAALKKWGILVDDVRDTVVRKAQRTTGKFRVISYSYDQNSPLAVTTMDLHQVERQTRVYIQGGETGKVLVPDLRSVYESDIIKWTRKYLMCSTSVVVLRASDPVKREKELLGLGFKTWMEYFRQTIDEMAGAFHRYCTAQDYFAVTRQSQHFAELLNFAVGERYVDRFDRWVRFLGWKKGRLERQLWFRLYRGGVPKVNNEVHVLSELLTVDIALANAVLTPQTLKRMHRWRNRWIFSSAFQRRHRSVFDLDGSYSTPLFSFLSTISFTSRQDSEIKVSAADREWILQMIRSYVETYSTL